MQKAVVGRGKWLLGGKNKNEGAGKSMKRRKWHTQRGKSPLFGVKVSEYAGNLKKKYRRLGKKTLLSAAEPDPAETALSVALNPKITLIT